MASRKTKERRGLPAALSLQVLIVGWNQVLLNSATDRDCNETGMTCIRRYPSAFRGLVRAAPADQGLLVDDECALQGCIAHDNGAHLLRKVCLRCRHGIGSARDKEVGAQRQWPRCVPFRTTTVSNAPLPRPRVIKHHKRLVARHTRRVDLDQLDLCAGVNRWHPLR